MMVSRGLLEAIELSTPSWGQPVRELPRAQVSADEAAPDMVPPTPRGLTSAQERVLAVLMERRWMTVWTVARALATKPTAAGTMLGLLIERGLVERERSPIGQERSNQGQATWVYRRKVSR